MLYAPGVYTGYDAKTLPGVREAVEQRHWAEANLEAARLAQVLEHTAAYIAALADQLKPQP
jgi:N-acetylated-alpha-linked acidic dipeptidase